MKRRGPAAFLACAANLCISVVASVLYYKELFHLRPYPNFANQLGAATQALLCGLALLALDVSGVAPRQQRAPVTLVQWLEMSVYLAVQNTLEIASIDGLGASNTSVATLLQQIVIPLTLISSTALLRARYGLMHLAAAALVLAGVAIAYIPVAISSWLDISWGWAFVFVLSRAPQALANVRLESLLDSQRGTVAEPCVRAEALLDHAAQPAAESGVRTACTAGVRPLRGDTCAQELRAVFCGGFWTGLMSIGFNAVTGLLLAAMRGKGVQELAQDYYMGGQCLLSGELGPVAPTHLQSPQEAHGSTCGGALVAWLAFAVPGSFFAVSEFHVVQQASAAAYFLVQALTLPLQAMVLCWPLVMGQFAATFHESLLVGIPIIVVGLVLWSAGERQASRPDPCHATQAAVPDLNSVGVEALGA